MFAWYSMKSRNTAVFIPARTTLFVNLFVASELNQIKANQAGDPFSR